MGLAERWGMFATERINQGPTKNKGINYHPVYGIPLPLLLPLSPKKHAKIWPSHLSPFYADVYVVVDLVICASE